MATRTKKIVDSSTQQNEVGTGDISELNALAAQLDELRKIEANAKEIGMRLAADRIEKILDLMKEIHEIQKTSGIELSMDAVLELLGQIDPNFEQYWNSSSRYC